ncbi:histidine kinase [Paenibacillus sp. LS1]|uniref:cache domain-containing sensor histidine kinase n=1 Tax=Paenibacillus sp. LS1 TaxID=2992120 RepID=UPI002231010C|nr:sensor histidine kinase [Paenibacillus sp. LS1]MCW3790230.1 histidine kinase [Paenibacillus sp. LS1]
MKQRIKHKILGSVILIVTLSLTACGLLALGYFYSLLERQTLRDGEIHLQQIEVQMNQLIEDIRKYSANMANDELIQQFATKTNYDSIYSELSAYSDVVQQLTKFNVLRDYLDSSAIIRTDGRVFWSSLTFDTYYQDEMNKPWLQNVLHNSAKSGFTLPHNSSLSEGKQVISFFIRVSDTSGGSGLLLLNIRMEAFTDIIGYLDLSFDRYAWFNNGTDLLLNHGFTSEDHPIIVEQAKKALPEKVEQKGFYLSKSLHNTEWSIITFISRDRFYESIQTAIIYFCFFFAVCIILCFLMFTPLISSMTRPISSMSRAMKQVSIGNYDIQLNFNTKDELMILKHGFESMISSIEQQMREQREQEKRQRRMSSELLFAQINPHFIYNTLNTVVYLSRKRRLEAIEGMVEALIAIMQDAVHVGGQDLFTNLEKERTLTRHYVVIQQYRYADRFELEWDVPDELLGAWIPRSLLQPLVENSIFHGLSELEHGGLIRISAMREGDSIIVSVADNGSGMEASTLDRLLNGGKGQLAQVNESGTKNIGIRNIQQRIQYLCGETYGLEMRTGVTEGTELRLRLPYMETPPNL